MGISNQSPLNMNTKPFYEDELNIVCQISNPNQQEDSFNQDDHDELDDVIMDGSPQLRSRPKKDKEEEEKQDREEKHGEEALSFNEY